MRTRGAPAALTHHTARHASGVSSPREMPFGARRWVRRRRPTSSPRARDATAGASRKVRRGKKHESAAHRSRATRQPSQPRSLSNLFWHPNPATERARMKNVDRACCMSKHSEIIAQFIIDYRNFDMLGRTLLGPRRYFARVLFRRRHSRTRASSAGSRGRVPANRGGETQPRCASVGREGVDRATGPAAAKRDGG